MENIRKKEGGMEKYISAFNEIDFLMEELFEILKIGLGEINAYPGEDMFRIIVNKTEVESLKSINEMFAKNDFSEAHRLMSPNVYIFVNWWCDNLDFMSVNISSLIASKEKALIISNAGKLPFGNFDKKRL
ncbi:hypothetical protein NFK47_04770 [Citrobacter freundii]|uniref:hypothetical protein n=1 Tax=Citrobacter freundii TaxID=546 RepID=UPI002433591F|nr:hypothetical protein [Citrobacter freundii]WFY93392.1 hypothetical protein NFK47_04770 [Citrobacter freundii]